MKIFRVFLKGFNGHFVDFPYSDEGSLANLMGFWRMEGVLSRADPMYGVPVAIPYDSWAFACVLVVEGAVQPGTSFDFLRPNTDPPKPN